MPLAVFAGRLPARWARGRFTYRRPSRPIQTPRPSPKPCSIGPIRAAVVRWQSARPTARPATCTRCTNSDPQIPIAPAEKGAPCPATPFPGGFRTTALGACGDVRAGPASETRHNRVASQPWNGRCSPKPVVRSEIYSASRNVACNAAFASTIPGTTRTTEVPSTADVI